MLIFYICNMGRDLSVDLQTLPAPCAPLPVRATANSAASCAARAPTLLPRPGPDGWL